MLSKWPIRRKLLIGIGLLLVIVGTLSISGLSGVYSYRGLVKALSGRASELPLASQLAREVAAVRTTFARLEMLRTSGAAATASGPVEALQSDFRIQLGQAADMLRQYREQLLSLDADDSQINDTRVERRTVWRIETATTRIRELTKAGDWPTDARAMRTVSERLAELEKLASKLPEPLHQRIHHFALQVRTQYRTLIILTWSTTVCAAMLLAVLFLMFYYWVLRPLRVLLKGSRRVAAGEFTHRIRLETHDEISELADAMNAMTARFQATRDDLDRQVKERTKQVVRSEQMAGVGFLAAGVAHEINNPLASIALCAESLESRIAEVLDGAPAAAEENHKVIRNYLRMIQEEAFRCKGITERLLDFSRMGDVQRHRADLRELVQGVIDMVGHLGKYHDKHIAFAPGPNVVAPVNAQEIKQVVLNLITNGLDSLSPGGTVSIALEERRGRASLTFTDDGCGMTDEVLEHLFEPFFTRSRGGQGTGLGLSITYRIVADHNGHIDVTSGGPGQGSQFRVSLPLTESKKEHDYRHQAA